MRFDQILRQRGRACGAVALAGQKFRRSPALRAYGIEADELGNQFKITFNPVKLSGVFARRFAAESGRYGIDENNIGKIECGVLVLDEVIRWRRLLTVRTH